LTHAVKLVPSIGPSNTQAATTSSRLRSAMKVSVFQRHAALCRPVACPCRPSRGCGSCWSWPRSHRLRPIRLAISGSIWRWNQNRLRRRTTSGRPCSLAQRVAADLNAALFAAGGDQTDSFTLVFAMGLASASAWAVMAVHPGITRKRGSLRGRRSGSSRRSYFRRNGGFGVVRF